jgi:hypothetical protein
VRRLLLSPKWLLGHVLVIVLAVAFCRLGWWQWDRYQQTHGRLQNLGYALQWPLFAVFGLARRMPPAPPPSTAVVPYRRDPEDDKLAAYNRYLASLYERDQEH